MGDVLEPVTLDVTECARCGGEHEGVVYRGFTRPNPHYVRWALCPANGEPILVRLAVQEPDGRLTPLPIDRQLDYDRRLDSLPVGTFVKVEDHPAGMDGAAPGAGRCGAEPGETP